MPCTECGEEWSKSEEKSADGICSACTKKHSITKRKIVPEAVKTQSSLELSPSKPPLKRIKSENNVNDIAINSPQTIQAPHQLCIMGWNLQDLGGGPSRGEQRRDDIINAIATAINKVNPHVCVILEVKKQFCYPKNPNRSELPTVHTRNTSTEVLLQKFMDHLQNQQAAAAVKADQTDESSKQGTGLKELDKIVATMNRGKKYWEYYYPPTYTAGETYGFIVRSSEIEYINVEYITNDKNGNSINWPNGGNRQPARATFLFKNKYTFDVIGFHAPSAIHKAEAANAMKNFIKLDYKRDTILMADTNLDTDADRDCEVSVDISDTVLENKANDEQCAAEIKADDIREIFEGLLNINSKNEHILYGQDIGATSLRKKIQLDKIQLDNGLLLYGELQVILDKVLLNNSFDKIIYIAPSSSSTSCLLPENAGVVPLHRDLLCQHLDSNLQNSSVGLVELQKYLNFLNEISDHLPVVLKLGIEDNKSSSMMSLNSNQDVGEKKSILSGKNSQESSVWTVPSPRAYLASKSATVNKCVSFKPGEMNLDQLEAIHDFGTATSVGNNCLLDCIAQWKKEDNNDYKKIRNSLSLGEESPIEITTNKMVDYLTSKKLSVQLYFLSDDGVVTNTGQFGGGECKVTCLLYGNPSHFIPLWPKRVNGE